MNKEMLFFLEAVANEKGLTQEDVFEAVEYALASAVKKTSAEEMNVRVSLDKEDGSYKVFRTWTVVDPEDLNMIEVDGEFIREEFNPNTMISLIKAQSSKSDIVLGEFTEEPLEAVDFGRISAQTAKQVIFQKLREASRRKIVEQFENRKGEIIHASIKNIFKGQVMLDLGDNIEGIIPYAQQIPSENYSVGKRIRAYLYEVGLEKKIPKVYLSRSMPAFVEELFKLEVPEISDGIIDIKSIAREAGERSKIAVFTGDPHLDPVGSCVGVRGTRVHAVTNELAGEKIDIIVWKENPAEFVINALSPAEIVSISVDEDNRSMDISVEDDLLAQAIGRSGQNVRLASQLTGWDLNVMSVDDMKSKRSKEEGNLAETFVKVLEISVELANALVSVRINSIEEVAYMPEKELLAIEGMTEEFATQIREKANDQILLDMLDEDGEIS